MSSSDRSKRLLTRNARQKTLGKHVAQNDQLRAHLGVAKTEIKRLKAQVLAQANDVTTAETKVATLERRLAVSEEALTQEQHANATLKTTLDQTVSEMKQLQDRWADQQRTKTIVAAEASEKMLDLKRKLKETEEALTRSSITTFGCIARGNRRAARASEWEGAWKQTRKELDRAKSELDANVRQVKQLKALLETTETKVKAAFDEERTKLMARIKSLSSAAMSSAAMYTDASRTLKRTEERSAALERQVTHFHTEFVRLQRVNAEAEKRIAAHEQAQTQHLERFNKLRAAKDTADAELKDARATIRSFDKPVAASWAQCPDQSLAQTFVNFTSKWAETADLPAPETIQDLPVNPATFRALSRTLVEDFSRTNAARPSALHTALSQIGTIGIIMDVWRQRGPTDALIKAIATRNQTIGNQFSAHVRTALLGLMRENPTLKLSQGHGLSQLANQLVCEYQSDTKNHS